MRAAVTGATGCVGSNLADLLVSRGHRVRALVRASSDTAHLESLGAELVRGDMGDPEALRGFVRDADVVFHCAALVSDWMDLGEMRRVNVEGLRSLLEACREEGTRRFIYMSSMVVLGMGRQENLDESAPYVHTGDNYNTTKIEAERLVLSFAEESGLPVTIIRAPYVYGPRDRQMLPRILHYLSRGKYAYIGGGRNPFTLVYAGNLADGLLRAAETPGSAGKIYNITDGEPVTRRRLIETICDEMGFERPRKNIPYPVARVLCFLCEAAAKILRLTTPPILNRFRLKFMHTYLTFDISRARRELGYGPDIPFEKAMRETLQQIKLRTE